MAIAQSFFPFSALLFSSSSSPTTRILPPPYPSSWSPSSHREGRRRAVAAASSLHLGPEDVAELVRNKVLIAATAASAVGQLSKPFTSGKDGGGGVDVRAAVRSGGMPSTHSAAVVAVATSLGLERGFADSIFGMSMVFAAIVMYDAQGVRREVGKHARVLNKLWTLREKITQNPEDDCLASSTSKLHSSKPEMVAELVPAPEKVGSSQGSVASPYQIHSSGTKSSRLNGLQSSETELTGLTQLEAAYSEECNRLSESVGHTELQVAAGAMLGFLVTLVVYATL
ncbi:hypothetical protein E2562_007830 [Oryza meyeriana var. granulata]|uniref:Uncharacterized protein n=1 Tax=Oryza meyeriana var. granulata TaxID=110450 RepID=A0A6G1F585_9ORYZ|nr:hypothetical protein E2562_007830 [Oryza meyeriana var. granulata]